MGQHKILWSWWVCKILLQWTKHQRSISLAGFRSQYHFQNDWTLGSLNQYYICLTFQSIHVYSVLALGFLPQVFCFNQLVFLSVCVVHDSHQTDTGDQQRQITLFTQLSSWNFLFKDLNVSSDPKSYRVVPVSHWNHKPNLWWFSDGSEDQILTNEEEETRTRMNILLMRWTIF